MSYNNRVTGYILLALCLLPSLRQGARAQPFLPTGATALNPAALQQLTITHTGDSCWLQLPIALWGRDVPRAHTLTLTPVLLCATDTAAFASVAAYGQWAYYHEARSGLDDSAPDLHFRAADVEGGRQRPYVRALRWQPWMDNCALAMRYEQTNGCGDVVAHWQVVVVPPPAVPAENEQPRPLRDRIHHCQGTAYVDFPLDETSIHADYHDNQRELSRIVGVIDSLRTDSTVIMQHISLRGYASPEGSYTHNEQLARERAAALRTYVVKRCGVDDRLVSSDYEAEDWQGLRRYVEASALPERDALLALIDQPADRRQPAHLDRKLQLMAARHPAAYRHLADSVFPYLRRTDYRIDYVGRYAEPAPLGSPATAATTSSEGSAATYAQPTAEGLSPRGTAAPETHSNFRTYRPLAALKSNLLFDAALTPNIEVEVPLRGRLSRWSIMVEDWFPWFRSSHNAAGDNSPYHRSDQRPTRRSYEVWTLGAELRYWLWPHCEGARPALAGAFVGLYGAGGKYDVERHSKGDQGEFTSVGLSLGYAWPIGRHWNIELSAAAGYVGGPQRHYEAEFDDARLIFRHYDHLRYAGPTKLKLSLVWLVGRKSQKGGAQ